MSTPPATVKTLHRIGEEIAAAIRNEDWERLSALVETRAEVVRRLPSVREAMAREGVPPADREAWTQSLQAQHDRLQRLLAAQRTTIEDELAEIEQLRRAHDSYDTPPSRTGILNTRLAG